MHTSAGTVWRGVPTAGDALFFPTILFNDGSAEGSLPLRVIGNEVAGGQTRGLLIEFADVASVCGYSETAYWSFAEETRRPQHFLNIIETSGEPARMAKLGRDGLVHYLLCGGDMCCEVLARDNYVITAFDTSLELEAQALRRRELELARLRL